MKCVMWVKSLAWCSSKLVDLRGRSDNFCTYSRSVSVFVVDQSTWMLHAVW